MKAWAVALLLVSLGLPGALPARADKDTGHDLLESGRQAYAAGRFAEAGTLLAAAAAARPDAAEAGLYLDAATAWRLAGDPGQATLWLLRAWRADPADAGVRKAMDAVGLPPPDVRLVLSGRLPPAAVWWTALAANALFWLGLAGLGLTGRPVARRVVVPAACLLVWLWIEAGWTSLGPFVAPRAVVLIETAARSAPEAEAEPLFVLQPGTLVDLGPRRGGYRLADAGQDRLGWIGHESLAPVTP